MKKLLSLLLAVVMMTCLLAGMTANARTTEGSYEYYYLSYANLVDLSLNNNERTDFIVDHIAFPAPDSTSRLYPVNAKWYNDTPGGNMAIGAIGSDGLVNYDNHSGNYYMGGVELKSAGKSRTIEVYVDTPGTYTIWALVPYDGAPSRSRQDGVAYTSDSFTKFKGTWSVAVNGGAAQVFANEVYNPEDPNNYQTVTRYTANPYQEWKNSFYWDKVTADFVAGKNELTLTATTTTTNISAMLITNDNARPSSKFAYIGTYEAWSTSGQGGNAYWFQNIKYFGDGQYHENWQADGFINLREYSDIDAPTLAIDEVGAVVTDNTIEFTWEANDPKREYVGRYAATWKGTAKNDNNGNPLTIGYAGNGTDVSTFVADASGIYETRIYENDQLIATFNDGTTSYTYDAPFTGSSYNFKVEVIDHYGNVTTDTAVFTTTGPADTQAPTWSGEIEVADESFGSTITWPEATDNTQILGYEIYENSVAPENLIELVTNVTTSYHFDLAPGETKNVVVVAKDRVGLYTDPLTATITSLAGTENYILRFEHFDMPDPSLRIWDKENISSDMIGRGGYTLNQGLATPYSRGNGMVSKTANAEMSAKIWVDEPGEYVAFAHIDQNGYGTYISLNGEMTSTAFGSNVATNEEGKTVYAWNKSDRTWYLEEGWNTVTLTSTNASSRLDFIYITNGETVEPSELTYEYANSDVIIGGKLNTAIYDDVAGPKFANTGIEVYYDATVNEAAITWPAAIDENENSVNGGTPAYVMTATGLREYKVYVNDKELGQTDVGTTSFTIDETTLGRALVPGEVLSIKVEALDKFGNKSIKTLSYEVSKFVVSSFAITNGTDAVDSLIALGTGTVKAELKIANVSDADADIRLAVAIYDETGNMLWKDYTVETIVADGVEVTVPVEITGADADLTGKVVKAHLWNADDLSPVSVTSNSKALSITIK